MKSTCKRSLQHSTLDWRTVVEATFRVLVMFLVSRLRGYNMTSSQMSRDVARRSAQVKYSTRGCTYPSDILCSRSHCEREDVCKDEEGAVVAMISCARGLCSRDQPLKRRGQNGRTAGVLQLRLSLAVL